MRLQVLVILTLLATPARAEDFHPEMFFGGTIDLASAFDKQGLPSVNEMRRGDSPFDNLKLTLYGDVLVHPRFAVLNQIILAPGSRSSIASFLRSYVRFTVVDSREQSLSLEAGKIPTPFGGYGGRAHSDVNPLISVPLMYHYFTSIRPNQLPADNADLLAHRGQGISSSFTGFAGGGASSNFNGLPVIYDSCWDTGVRALGSIWRFEYSVAMTQGTLGGPSPNGGDNNDGKQFTVHLDFVPNQSVVVGGSFGIGPYLTRDVAASLPAGKQVEDYDQVIWGANIEVSFGHVNLLAEAVHNTWTSPFVVDASGGLSDLTVLSAYAEGRIAVSPGLFVAARAETVRFGNIEDGSGSSVPWDDHVDRFEGGFGYFLTDRTIGKLLVQLVDKRGLGGFREAFPAAQLSVSF